MTTGVFNYIDPTTITRSGDTFVKPWSKVDVDKSSSKQTARQRPVANLRDFPASSFGTDVSGFALFTSPGNEKDFTDDSAVRNGYYAEVEALVRAKLPGVKKVVIFDHTIRRRIASSPRQPVQQVHVDQTPGAAEARVRRHVADPAEADELLRGRYQIVNVWRPIGYPATDSPLALIDWRSTRPEDLVAVDLLYPVYREGYDGDDRGKEKLPDQTSIDSTEGYEVRGETYSVAPSDDHEFFYVKDMTPDEVLFLKCFDSRGHGFPGGVEGRANCAPHTAFADPATPPGTKGRQSIEVRCLVFYE
ncbi:hypothetical protein SODALDRAFT_340325 [Sodiomyces alkalinus F11]|uniref:Methyltransferase n=1 Tax=Sodiomyces alkalinus (strain CBS 110278 / VKM F-3762 / F11) TaxID=1314773 RepID=A0A3N2PU72_SODAK|nr:hypothetical protein SODALDRAFT_340325 [Sodiomyces alkalinus F11]ROT38045.1 hypothetical protein SODALDRAFT_340325 [Sodiomyces alkalinus F11]